MDRIMFGWNKAKSMDLTPVKQFVLLFQCDVSLPKRFPDIHSRRSGERKSARLNVSLSFQHNMSRHASSFTRSGSVGEPSFVLCLPRWICVFWMSRGFAPVVSFSCSSHSSLKTDGAGKVSRWLLHFLSLLPEAGKLFRESQEMCFVVWN